jgi:cell division septal protein FtsQ
MKAALLTLAVVAGGASVLAAGAARAPDALRNVDEFRVAHVVVHGAAYLEPEDVLAASGIGPASSVFDDMTPWRAALLAHPLIVDVRIERELPATIELHIRESSPLAFVATPELRPVDARGYVLPVRARGPELDLPVLVAATRIGVLDPERVTDGEANSFSRVVDDASLAAIRALDAIRRLDPVLESMISEIAPVAAGDVRLTLRRPAGTVVLLPAEPDAERVQAVRLTLAHLGDAAVGARIDARFREQVVVKPAATAAGTRALSGGAR